MLISSETIKAIGQERQRRTSVLRTRTIEQATDRDRIVAAPVGLLVSAAGTGR
ncbi:MAG: hypothetical protein WD652_02825 [Acidimicrobiia bacterium]